MNISFFKSSINIVDGTMTEKGVLSPSTRHQILRDVTDIQLQVVCGVRGCSGDQPGRTVKMRRVLFTLL